MKHNINEIKNFLKKNYGLEITKIDYITHGVMNFNYLVEAERERYIFKIYNFKNKEQVLFEAEILQHLIEKQFPCPKLKPSFNGELILNFKNKPCVVYDYIEGESPKKIIPELMYQLGEAKGRMHKICEDFIPSVKKSTWDPEDFKILAQGDEDIKKELVKYNFPDKLPTGVTHQDIKPENIIMKDGKISGILDFDNAYVGVLLHDITTPIIWSCFVDGNLDKGLLESFLLGYNKEREMTDLEKEYLMDGIKFRLVREIFIGPFVTKHYPGVSLQRWKYFKSLYKKITT